MKTAAAEPRAYQIVFDYFTDQIYNGTFKIGSRLPPEREIAEQLGVSRNSTREAIRMLEMMGFVESLQGSGNYIRCKPQRCITQALNMTMALHETNFEDLLRTYQTLGRETLRLAVSVATEEDLNQLDDQISQMEQAEDLEELLELDDQFRETVAASAHSDLLRYLLRMTGDLMDSLADGLWREMLSDEQWESMFRAIRREIAQGLAFHNEDQVQQALTQYFAILEERTESLSLE